MNLRTAFSRVIRNRLGAAELATSGVICMLTVLACRGDTDSTAGWDGTVRDSAGVQIVENLGAPLWPEGPGWEFTQDLRIGAVDGPPEYQFGRIGGLQVLSDGRFAVTDVMAHDLRIFSQAGEYECTVGRPGQGPGEFGSGSLGLFWGPGDTLLVSDPANNRMNIVAPNGTWLDSWPRLPMDGSAGSYWTGSVPTGRLVSVHHPLRQNDGTLTDTLDIALERNVHGAILDTLARLPSYLTFFRGGPETLMRYYNAWWEVRQWGAGLMIARTDRYRFSFYGPDGGLERIVSLVREPLAITDEDRSVMLAGWDAFLQERGVPADTWEEYKSRLLFSDTYPSYRLSFYGPAGTLLVQRVRPLHDLSAEERKEVRANSPYAPRSAEWDVFDAQGRYLGVVVIPGTGFPKPSGFFRFYQDRTSGTWYMASVWEDELEVQFIVRWRIDGRMPVGDDGQDPRKSITVGGGAGSQLSASGKGAGVSRGVSPPR